MFTVGTEERGGTEERPPRASYAAGGSYTLPVSDLAPGAEFAGCRIEGVAGRGGMGVVYRATQLALGRTVALKLVAADRAAEPRFQERFERESQLAAAIDHPNVIPVFGAGEEDGRFYLVMRYVRGTDLQRLLTRSGRLQPARAAGIIAQVAAGLDAAHAAGLVHRDVKPANVLLGRGPDHVYLSDFGLTLAVSSDARITESGEWIGTVDFMAPEQFAGERVDGRADVYALGCLLHAALTGQAPFRRETVAATIYAHLHDAPPRPSATAGVPVAFDAVIVRALAKRPEDRYQSAGELARAALAAAGAPAAEPAGTVALEPGSNGDVAATAIAHETTAAFQHQPQIGGHAAARPESAPPIARTARITRSRRRLTGVAAGAIVLVAAVAIAAVSAIAGFGPFGGDDSGSARSGPLSAAEVRAAVDAFARAYGREDGKALARVVTRGVARVTPADTQRGRDAVVAEYERQFARYDVRRYTLTGLEVRGGGAGRASGRYTVSRSGRAPIAGEIAFGVQREQGRGRARIALIAANPDR
jgi:hypothetical protein